MCLSKGGKVERVEGFPISRPPRRLPKIRAFVVQRPYLQLETTRLPASTSHPGRSDDVYRGVFSWSAGCRARQDGEDICETID
jgi:hypothetical protein